MPEFTVARQIDALGIEGSLSEQTVNVLPASMIYADKFAYYYPEGRIWNPGN